MKTHSMDLRERIVASIDAKEGSQREIARRRTTTARAIQRAGATILRLPPYSSDYNPIEEMWSKLKHRLRQAAARTTERLHQALTDAFNHITTKNIEGWFRHSGLYASQK